MVYYQSAEQVLEDATFHLPQDTLIKRRELPILKHVAKPLDEAGFCDHLLEIWLMLLPTNGKTRPITI